MSKFSYTARNRSGRKENGEEEAASKEELISRLQARDLFVVSIISAQEGEIIKALPQAARNIRRRHTRITEDDLVLFCRQLATLLGAGVTIMRSLDIIAEQVSSTRLYNVVLNLQRSMESGLSFHESMGKYPKVFSELWVNLVESGEASGNLAVVLGRLAGYLERDAAFKRKIVSALIYPALLLVVGTGALLFMTVKIIPTFAALFQGFNVELPVLTKVLLGVSNVIRSKFILIIGVIIAAVLLFRQFISTKDGRKVFEGSLFKLPLFGDFFRAIVIERFTSEMSTLTESGVPILYSLEITERSVDNLVLGDIIRRIKDDVRDGKSISSPMQKSGFFDPMAVQMVNIGEEIGDLANMFKRLNQFYQEYVDTFVARFTVVFEPIMLIFMGGVIGVMVIGLFLPIFKIASISQ